MFTTQDILNSKHFTSKNIVLHELNLKETKERLANSFTRIIMDDKFSFDDVIGEAVIRNIIPNVEIIHSTKLVNELKYKNDKKTILVSKHLENSFKEYHVHNNKSDYRYIIIIANIISSSLNIPAPMAE
ncbi:MAG: hypothetical protein N3A54_02455, partial [Patescibacteria group bacterium]|nr:hypothetical protein [Patescibacteria group bacterium]